MRRLATLVVVAVAAVGCTKGGEAGPAGQQGSSGYISYLDQTGAPSITAAGVTYACVTPTYTAVGGEVAFITTRASCYMPASGYLSVRSGYNDGANKTVGFWLDAQNNNPAGNGYVFNAGTGTLVLTAGTTYTFSTAMSVGSVPAGTCWCQTVVQIAKPTP